ncbi:MAG: lipid-A-disaccharide synthase [Phycisphaeraceae bacterium]
MAQPSDPPRTIFFAAFEPSGDILAARLINELRRRDPALRFTGFGGPKMQAAGAQLVEVTTEHATIALGALGQINEHRRRLRVLDDYLGKHEVAALVPVDSPAANWSVCKRVRKHQPGATIVHLVCPQIWGWATWRVRRLRNLTDKVLCLLPFEPGWLSERGVPGVFVGHPVFEDAPQVLDRSPADDLPGVAGDGGFRLALMPGSRRGELVKNWPTMLEVYRRVEAEHAGLAGVVAAREPGDERLLRAIVGGSGWPAGLSVVGGRTPEVLRWCDAVLAKSGTTTLQIASLRKPMVVYYNVNPAAWHGLGRWLIQSRTFALPNIVSEWQDGRRVVPEFVPHFGDPAPLASALSALIGDAALRERQVAGLGRVAEPFASVCFKDAAAEALLDALAQG